MTENRGIALTVTIVIPTWQRRDLLARLVPLLSGHAVIVVDNGSTDGSAEYARQQGAQVIRFESNQGFARAVNRGLAAAETDLVAIVNNDVEPSPAWLPALTAALAARPDAWFATGKLLRGDGRLDGAFDLLTRAGLAWRAGADCADAPVWNQPRDIASAPMTAAVFRRALFDRVGWLDEDYGSYYEDVDFGLRCALAGCGGLYVPEAVARHESNTTLGGAWRPETVRLLARNQALLARKHFSGPTRAIVAGQWLWGLLAMKHGQWNAWRAGRREAELFAWRSTPPDARLDVVLAQQERELYALQDATGGTPFWRWLRRLMGSYSQPA